MTTTPPQDRKCDSTQLKVGDRLSRIQYYQVLEFAEDGATITVQNEAGFKFNVTPNIVEAEMFSAAQFTREEKISRTELVDRLEQAGETVFTVTFLKQVTDKAMAEKLADLDGVELDTDRKRRAYARTLLKGQRRTLVGYLLTAQPKLGRSMVIDLEVPEGKNNVRMVDHRTIQALVLKNVRYHCE